jgi:SNF2 family DNA or RNA helicase
VIVELDQGGISVRDSEDALSSIYKSQLRFWGFRNGDEKGCLFLPSTNCGQALAKLVSYFDSEHLNYSLGPRCEAAVSKLRRASVEFSNVKQAGLAFKAGTFSVANFEQFKVTLQSLLKRTLKEHQFRAAYHMHLTRNAANFSVPGSGKTSVVLSLYEKLRKENKVNCLFVVGPASCFGPWQREFADTLGREPGVKILAGGHRDARKSEYYKPSESIAELYLSTFQTLFNDEDEAKVLFQKPGVKMFFVIDEAHYIKQIGGNWSATAIELAEFAVCRCLLTGTPCPHSYTDLFNLFNFLWPMNDPIGSENRVRVQLAEQQGKDDQARKILEEAIGPLFYRVTKSDLGLTRPIFHPPILVPMNGTEQFIYDAITLRIRNSSRFDYSKNATVVMKLRRARILRLRQCSAYVPLLLKPITDTDDLSLETSDLYATIRDYDAVEVSAKIQALERIVTTLRNRNDKVVIWCNFIGTLKHIHKRLTTLGMKSELLYGETPIEQVSVGQNQTREQIINLFKEVGSGVDILIANPGACAESISLHKTCHNAVYYDLSYNCAQYLQSLDRIHRVGGSETQEAHYYFLQNNNAIDQDVMDNITKKAQKMFALLNDELPAFESAPHEDEDEEIKAYERLFG